MMGQLIDFASPNWNKRPDNIRPDMVIIHYTGMETCEAALERLCDPTAEVSAHYLIDQNGDTYGLVNPENRAWHAGVSSWQGRDNINHYSIGIELVNPGHEFGYENFPDIQIGQLLVLLSYLRDEFVIADHMYVGHSDIAPMRKDDPGEKFPWHRLAKAGFGIISAKNGSSTAEMSEFSDNPSWIISLQKKLASIGYAVEETGEYDALTTAAVRAFQRHWRQETVTGLYDVGTDIILNDIIYQKGQICGNI